MVLGFGNFDRTLIYVLGGDKKRTMRVVQELKGIVEVEYRGN